MENIPLGFVYYLQNPITGEIFYVGVTQSSLKNRLKTHYQHLSEALKGKRNMNNRYYYLLELHPVKATIHLLEIITDGNIYEREIFYIKKFRSINPKLTNMTDGGRGKSTSKYYTDEERKILGQKIKSKLSGLKKPDGFSKHLSNIRKGIQNPAAKEISIGWIVADEKYLFKYGFEVNSFIGKKDAYGSVHKHFKKGSKGSPYKHKWELFSNLNKETQDIVQSLYESKEY